MKSCFVDDMKDLCIDKADEKDCPVEHVYNNKKKIFVLIYLSKIPGVSQDIDFCFAAIIGDNDNDNIRFYLPDITQIYTEIPSDLNLDFYI